MKLKAINLKQKKSNVNTTGQKKKLGGRVIAGGLAIALVAGCSVGGVAVYKSNFGGSVAVYYASDITTTNWEDQAGSEARIGTQGLQLETISSTMTVESVSVTQGQKVKKGDELFRYDTTLTDLDLQRKSLQIQQEQLELKTLQGELKTIKSYKPNVPIKGSQKTYTYSDGSYQTAEDYPYTTDGAEGTPDAVTVEGVTPQSGKGTEQKPYVYEWQEGYCYTNDYIQTFMQGKREAFVTFVMPAEEQKETEEKDKPTSKEEDTEKDSEDTSADTSEDTSGDTSGDTSESEDDTSGDESEDEGDTSGDESEDEGDTSGDESEDEGDTSGDASEDEGDTSGDESEDEGDTSEDEGDTSGDTSEDEGDTSGDESEGEGDTSGDTSGDVSDPEPTPEPTPVAPSSWTMQFQLVDGVYQYQLLSMSVGGVTQKVASAFPALPQEEKPKPVKPEDNPGSYTDPGISYTKQELAEMRQSKEQEIQEKNHEIRVAEINYRKAKKEAGNSSVFAEMDGVVTYVGDKEDTSGTFVKVSASDGGYIIRTAINELSLSTVQAGNTATVRNEMTMESWQGVIQSVGEYPTKEFYNYSGNSNSSYYPVEITLGAEANISEDDWIQAVFGSTSTEDTALYLDNAFVFSENGKSYIYAKGSDGVLEKRQVLTGRSLYGYYTEIKKGINRETQIAFPYGKNVREGAEVREANLDELYGG